MKDTTYFDIYIGFLDDPNFSWGKAGEDGRLPTAKSLFFPSSSSEFFDLINSIEKGEFKGGQVDWGGWVAIVTKAQIIEFMDKHFNQNWINRHINGLQHLNEKLTKIKEFVNNLEEHKEYALVACEL